MTHYHDKHFDSPDNRLYRQAEHYAELRKTDDSDNSGHCRRCGARLTTGAAFCEECGEPVSSSHTCPNCHAEVAQGMAICPVCGHSLVTDRCSFCGAPMDHDDRFCAECGNPREGIRCPRCGAHNQRSFCRVCSQPLNDMALKMIERVKDDPRVAEAHRLALELAELEAELTDAGIISTDADGDTRVINLDDNAISLTDEERRTLADYDSLMSMAGNTPADSSGGKDADNGNAGGNFAVKERRRFKVGSSSAADAIAAYRLKAREMQAALDAIVPDEAMNAEEQRNFFTACHIVVMTEVTTRSRVKDGWICNWCGCHHSTPSECYRPELGGKWIYREIEVKTRAAGTDCVNI